MSQPNVSGIQDKSLKKALQKSLEDDGRLSDDEVRSLLLSTLDGDGVTKAEREGLRLIANRSKSMSDSSRKLIHTFVSAMAKPRRSVSRGKSKRGNFSDIDRLILSFMQSREPGRFPNLDRAQIGIGLLTRVRDATLINQGDSSLCGPAAFLLALATQSPKSYVKFAINLYDKGEATLGLGGKQLSIRPGTDCRNSNPDSFGMDHVDWLTLGSLRDSMNSVFDYDDDTIYQALDWLFGGDFRGATKGSTLASWFRRAGFRVIEETSLTETKDFANLKRANELRESGHFVSLFINSKILSNNSSAGSLVPNHWVVLRKPIMGLSENSSSVDLTVFSWGKGNLQVPKGPMSNLLGNYFGFVAAKGS